ncbi:MAG TPA: hypothetical protein VJT54_11825 [Verrucomicrobiae bacterium]|nr:hypothetical protein [Verrucomicrobiae bacterium]
MRIRVLSLLLIPLVFTGCASIFDGGSKSVQINSNPQGAKVTISNQEGKTLFVRTTPAFVTLDRASGYFRGEDYKLVLEAAGYNPYETHVVSTIDGWYFGNILLGGLVGMLIVDPMTGDMYTLSPMDVNCNLVPVAVASPPGEANAMEPGTNIAPESKLPAEPEAGK